MATGGRSSVGAVFGLMGALSIGVSDLFTRRVVQATSVLVASVMLSLFAIVTSVAAVMVFGSTMHSADFGLGLLSGLGLGVGLATYYLAINHTSATVASPIVAALSAIIPYGYALVRGASPTVYALVGAAVALGGVVLITVGSGGTVERLRAGVIWAAVSGVVYGLGFAVVLGASRGAGALPAVGQRVSAMAVLLAAAAHRRSPLLAPAGTRLAGAVGGAAAGLATVFYLAGARHDPTGAIITTSMFPAASVGVGRMFFGDPLSRRQMLGLVVVLVGTVAVVTG